MPVNYNKDGTKRYTAQQVLEKQKRVAKRKAKRRAAIKKNILNRERFMANHEKNHPPSASRSRRSSRSMESKYNEEEFKPGPLDHISEDEDEPSQSRLTGGLSQLAARILALDPDSPAGLPDTTFGGWLYTHLISSDDDARRDGVAALLNMLTPSGAFGKIPEPAYTDIKKIFLPSDGAMPNEDSELSKSLIHSYAVAKANNDTAKIKRIIKDADMFLKGTISDDQADALIRAISVSKDPRTGRNIADLLSTPMIRLTTNNPVELRDALQQSFTMSLGFRVSGKQSGKNLPGAYGANYSFPVINPGETVPHFDNTVFYKQTTDKDKKTGVSYQNFQESISEVLAGNSINDVVGAYSGLALTSLAPDYPGTPASKADYVYIGSQFHKQFVSLRSAAYVEGLKRKKAPIVKMGVVVTDPRLVDFKKGLLKVIDNDTHLQRTFGSAIASNLDVGNYQFHAENLGFAVVNGVRSVVSLDYGGAFRRPYTTTAARSTAPVKEGRFERNLNPLRTAGLKYGRAYLADYPKGLIFSPGFFEGFEVVTKRKLLDLHTSVKKRVEQAIQLYGPEIFFDKFVSELDTRGPAENFFTGIDKTNEDAVANATIDFLYDARIGRQLSMVEFVAQSKLRASSKIFPPADVYINNPAYALFNKKTDIVKLARHPALETISSTMLSDFGLLKNKDKTQAISHLLEAMIIRLKTATETIAAFDDSEVPRALLNQQVDLLAWKDYLQTAFDTNSRHYDLKSEKDLNTLMLACDEAYRQVRDTHKMIADPSLQYDFLKAQQDVTPDFIPNDAEGAETYLQDMKVKAGLMLPPLPLIPPMPPPSPTHSPASSSSSRSSRFNWFGNRSLSSSPKSSSPVRKSKFSYNFFRRKDLVSPVNPDDLNSISKTIVDYVQDLEPLIETNRSARISVREFLRSQLGRAVANLPGISKLKDIIAEAKIKLPSLVQRSVVVDTTSFNPDTQSEAQAINSPTSATLVNGQSVMSYVVGTGASYAGSKANNLYSVKAVTLESAMDRHNILQAVLSSPAFNLTLTDAELKKIMRFYRRYEYNSFSQDNAINSVAHLKLKEKLAEFPELAAKADEFMVAMTESVRQKATVGTVPPDLFISDSYIDYVDKQIREYIAEAGSNSKISIDISNDPYLVSAYVAVCDALNISYENKNTTQYLPATPAAIARLQAQPVHAVKDKLKNVITDLTREVAIMPNIADDVRDKVAGLQTQLQDTGKVSLREMYSVVDEIHTVKPSRRLRSI